MSLIAELFEKISHPTRLKILSLLQDNPMNFSQLKAALNIDSNGNLDHHLKKLDTLIYLDAGGLYKLSDDGREAIQAIEIMEATIKPRKEPEVSAQANRVFYAFLAITIVFPIAVAVPLVLQAFSEGSTLASVAGMLGILIAMTVGLVLAVFSYKRTIKADLASSEPLTYFPSSKDPWSRGDWLRNVGFFGSYLGAFLSLIYIEFSSVDLPGKFMWVVVSLLVLIALGYTSQTLIYSVIEKANSRIRSSQTPKSTAA